MKNRVILTTLSLLITLSCFAKENVFYSANDIDSITLIENINRSSAIKDGESSHNFAPAYNEQLSNKNADKVQNVNNIALEEKYINKKYRSYNPYDKKLRNKIIARHKIVLDDITIFRNELEPKVRVKDKARAYEYIILNNSDDDIVINKVVSEHFIGLGQIATYCKVPNVQQTIPIYGTIYSMQTDIEKNKFTRPHPVNETIEKGDGMRVLALSKKKIDPVVDFIFTINDEKIEITFDPKKAQKL